MRTRSVLTILAVAALAGSQTAFADNIAYSVNPVGFTGGIYLGSGSLEKSTLTAINNGGAAIGLSTIYNGTSASVGQAAWYYNPLDQSTIQIGLIGGVYLNSNGFVQASLGNTLYDLSATGYTAGLTSRYAGTTSLGSDAWVYSPSTGTVFIPLPTPLASDPAGTSYSKSVSGGVFDGFSVVSGVSNTGQVVGTASRYDSSGNSLGSDLVYYDPATNSTIPIGLFDADNVGTTGNRNSIFSGIGPNGQVIGSSQHYVGGNGVTPTGADIWYYAPGSSGAIVISYTDVATPTSIGHVAPNGTQSNGVNNKVNALGQVVGYSSRYDATNTYLGQDVFLYDPVAGETIIGLSGTGYVSNTGTQSNFYNTSGLSCLSDTGQVVGYTNRFDVTGATSLGQDAWFYDSQAKTPTTIAIALTGGDYTKSTVTAGDYHSSKPITVSNGGQVAGIALRYDSSGNSLGQDSWFYDSSMYNASAAIQTPVRVGLIGGVYEETVGSVGFRNSTITAINATGEVAGYSTRYLANVTNGQDAWIYYNGAPTGGSNVTQSIDPTDPTAYFYSTITAIADNGVAVGYYSFTNSPAVSNATAFAWTQANGFINLGLAVSPSVTLADWQDLAEAMKISSAGTIFGYGQLAGDSSSSQSVFRLNQLLPGDANGDGVVDLNDLNIVLNNLGTTNGNWAAGNFDGAATIDLNDLNDVLNHLGVHTAPGTVAALSGGAHSVPEPASLSLLALGGFLLMRRRNTVS